MQIPFNKVEFLRYDLQGDEAWFNLKLLTLESFVKINLQAYKLLLLFEPINTTLGIKLKIMKK